MHNRMKIILFLLLVCFCFEANAQNKDTLFIKRTLVDTPYHFYHAIYIDSNYSKRPDNNLTKFRFSRYDKEEYVRGLKQLKPLTKKLIPNNLPREWILLYKYKGDYVTYLPSEWGNHYRFKITGSTTIDYTMEGAEAGRINKIIQVSKNEMIIYRYQKWGSKTITINIIDREKGIAIFTFGPTEYRKTGYKLLMLNVKKANLYPTIINYCATDKMLELDFEEIDFTLLEK